jgi:beta-lactamase regulating signal transducer with metallopeptidase domain
MSGMEMAASGWLLHTAVGGSVLLLLAWLLTKAVRQPARRQRVGEWGVVAALALAALSLAPSWLFVTLPAEDAVPAGPAAEVAQIPPPPLAAPSVPPEPLTPRLEGNGTGDIPPAAVPAFGIEAPAAEPEAPLTRPSQVTPVAPEVAQAPVSSFGERLWFWLRVLYAGGAALMLGHWLLGHVALLRILRTTEPAPEQVTAMFARMSGRRRVRLRMSRRVGVPFSCGVFRPTVVLPAGLAEGAAGPELRWVLAHELTHLERRDAWAGLLFGAAHVLYFFLPWFWWLRRQVRLCQEYVADAVAAAAAGGPPADYAQFLLGWTGKPGLPAGATGVFGYTSDLFRRVTMLLQSPVAVEKRCPRRWSLVAASGLLGLAVVAAGIGLRAEAAPVPEQKKDEPRKEEPKKEEPKKEQPVKPAVEDFPLPLDIEKLLKDLGPGMTPEQMKQLQGQLEQARKEVQKALEQARVQVPNRFGGMGGGFGGMGGMGGGMGGFGRFGTVRSGDTRLGVLVEKPGGALADQLDLPKDQGLIVEEVVADSAAAKAGMKAHDVLLELNGKPVPSDVEKFAKQLEDVKANTPVDAVVLRKGKKETLKGLSLPEVKRADGAAGFQGFQNFQPFPGGFPNVPNIPNVPNLPNFQGGNGVMTTVMRTDDRFTTRYQEGTLSITVTGKVADGKPQVNEINVVDGGAKHKFESVDKVPEQYRDKVKHLVEMSEKGNFRIELKKE